jgi:hypothetical protein
MTATSGLAVRLRSLFAQKLWLASTSGSTIVPRRGARGSLMAFVHVQCVPDGNVAEVLYSSEDQTLRIIYQRNARAYDFYGVDEKTAEGFSMSGVTAGRYYRAAIMGRFGYQEI